MPSAPPVVTLVVAIVVALCNLAQVFWPQIVPALWRDPKALASGQVWRLVSPLLVQSDGFVAFLFVFAGLLLIGLLLSHSTAISRWIILFFAGGLVGIDRRICLAAIQFRHVCRGIGSGRRAGRAGRVEARRCDAL